jgi:PucR family transcriptional regulator, purine catabolism regulatory protein
VPREQRLYRHRLRGAVQTRKAVLTLGDLLDEQELGLVQRTGPPDAAARGVLGAAVVEVDSPARWIAADWVLLTAGVRLEGGTDDALRALVAECDEAGIAALAFGVGPVFDELPEALLAEGEARSYPIVAVPLDTPFRDVVRYVDAAIMGADAPLFRRLSSLQRFVVDALRDPEPERAVVERLARFMDASVAVLGPDGSPEIALGSAPLEPLWEAIGGHGPAVLEAEADGWHAVAAPLAARAGEAPRWLLLASPRAGFIGTLAKRAAESTAPLLVAMERLKEVANEQELAVRGALLDEALAPGAADVASLAARARAFELDFAEPARVVLVRRDEATELTRHELGEALARIGAPCLVSERDGAVVALVQAPREAIEAELAGALAGIGRPVEGIGALRESLRDAELALQRAASEPGGGPVAFEQFDLGTLLLSETAPERLEPKVAEVIAVLREHPPLHDALVSYFAHDLDVGAAANELHLHPNSLRYRLTRVEELLGCSLKRPATIAELHIALLADRRTRRERF